MELAVLSWNLFHGRDFPPDPDLLTWRSRLLRRSERNATHIQVNRDLGREFAGVLADAEWDVALLQECPPRFCGLLSRACDAEPHRVLTSRNSFGRLRGLAARLNPDLIASGEGGSNLTLVRRAGPAGSIVERREAVIHAGPSERRAMAFTRTGSGLCIANLHASAHLPELAADDVLRAAERATGWAGDAPLVFGGDLNLRPSRTPSLFEELERRFGISGVTEPDAIDHLLRRDLAAARPPRRWAPERREVRLGGLALRLSDHAPVEARFAT